MDRSQIAYFPAPRSEFVELGRVGTGKVFRKQILAFGDYQHPNDPKAKLVIDRGFGETLVRNFEDGVCDIVQIPKVDGKNVHNEDPDRNLGEVLGLTIEEGHTDPKLNGVYANMDFRKQAEDVGTTLLGVSAMMAMDYTDTKTGRQVGPTLLHTAITNRPYITNLKGFEELVAASADQTGEGAVFYEAAETEEKQMDKDELIAALRDEHGIDVEALQETANRPDPQPDLVAALSKVLKDAGTVSLARPEDEPITVTEVAEAVVELSQEKVDLENQVADLVQEREQTRDAQAEREVDDLIKTGRILPKQRAAMIGLSRNDHETFEALVPDQAVVMLDERGVTVHDDGAVDKEKFDEDISRLVELSQTIRGGK